ncbi:MAG: heme o synthase [Gemmatimonadota bacterium]
MLTQLAQTPSPYLELTKPRINAMVLVTTALGYVLAGGRGGGLILFTLAGTACAAGGAAVLNHYLERDADAAMRRTRRRPLPSGRIRPSSAMSFGLLLILAGLVLLVARVNLLTAFLALLTAFLYVVVYTPMKRLTWLNTTLGAIPGALPPVGGWAAATGHLDLGAWALFAILFAWQHPHFYAIAWIFREDYGRGGFRMLPLMEEDGRRTGRHIVVFTVLLVAVSLLPTALGLSGRVYLGGAVILGLGFLAASLSLALTRTALSARRVLRASIVYLPLLLALTLYDLA